MRLSTALTACAAAVFLAAASAVPATAQKSYPVVCNAGGNMMAEVSSGNTVRVRFDPGRRGAGSTPPNAGECAWLDRGFRSGEPNILLTKGNGRHADYIISAVRKGETFYAHIRNNRRGAMVVERIGP
jgi:hypothetical protein